MKFSPKMEQACSTFVLVACTLSLSVHSAQAQISKTKDGEDAETLDPIVVTGSTDNKDTIAQSEISSDLIDRTQSATIPGLLSSLPGIELIGNSRVQGQSINIMGFGDSEDIEITIDGAQKSFEKYQQGSVFIDPELLKVIDITKGTFSPEKYGAFGGSVEMTTKAASDMLRDGLSYGAFAKVGFASNGNELVKSAATYARSEEQGFEILIAGTHRSNDDYSVAGNDEELALSAGNLLTGHFKASLEREDHFFELSGIHSYSDDYKPWAARRGLITVSDWSLNKYGSFDEYLKTQAVDREMKDTSISGTYEYNPDSDLIDLEFEASYSKTAQHDTRRVPVTDPDYSAGLYVGGDDSTLDYSIYKLDLKNTSVFNWGIFENTLKYGVQLRHEIRDSMAFKKSYVGRPEYNDGRLQPYNIPSGTQTIWSAWGEYTLGYGALELTPGLRYDYIHSKGEANLASKYNNTAMNHDYGTVERFGFSPSISAVYSLSPNIKLFGDYAYKLRAPLIDEFYDVGSTRATATQLQNERVSAKRIGVASTFKNVLIENDTVKARVAVYRNDVSDNIYRLLSENSKKYDDPVPTYGNLAGYYTQGFEAELYYDSERFFGSIAFSRMQGKHDGTLKDVDASIDQYVSEVAPTKLVLSLGYKVPEADIAFGWKGRFVDEQVKVPDNYTSLYSPSKGYAVHDVFLTWTPQEGRFAGLEARASIENLFNKNYRPYFADGAAPDKGINFKSSVSYKF
ncbi:TonB-dependent heme/hemoglobin receptor family protein [Pseudovibrio sp. FO-BEG1]|uniref:TonB-dependent receptor domain-containing protein n=1 Tax=Pseudovibrio sp. (strain FO-BEG1) TaxID=911045 RepID=UPI000238C400|nr:TonB-dependent receptor [Pseudovibrio sp. FO-BEG1]AEV36650.1 TonB-dependent heme/hemoglobin receptor family protein [Pseudovibrio sp. FO-BEG1]